MNEVDLSRYRIGDMFLLNGEVVTYVGYCKNAPREQKYALLGNDGVYMAKRIAGHLIAISKNEYIIDSSEVQRRQEVLEIIDKLIMSNVVYEKYKEYVSKNPNSEQSYVQYLFGFAEGLAECKHSYLIEGKLP